MCDELEEPIFCIFLRQTFMHIYIHAHRIPEGHISCLANSRYTLYILLWEEQDTPPQAALI